MNKALGKRFKEKPNYVREELQLFNTERLNTFLAKKNKKKTLLATWLI